MRFWTRDPLPPKAKKRYLRSLRAVSVDKAMAFPRAPNRLAMSDQSDSMLAITFHLKRFYIRATLWLSSYPNCLSPKQHLQACKWQRGIKYVAVIVGRSSPGQRIFPYRYKTGYNEKPARASSSFPLMPPGSLRYYLTRPLKRLPCFSPNFCTWTIMPTYCHPFYQILDYLETEPNNYYHGKLGNFVREKPFWCPGQR